MKHWQIIILDWFRLPSDLLFAINTPLWKVDIKIFEIWKVERNWRYRYSTTRIIEWILKYRFKKQGKNKEQ